MKKVFLLLLVVSIGLITVSSYNANSQTTPAKPDTTVVIGHDAVLNTSAAVVDSPAVNSVTDEAVTEEGVDKNGMVKQVKWNMIFLYLIALFGCFMHYFAAIRNNATMKLKTVHSSHWIGMIASAGLTVVFVYGYDFLPDSVHKLVGELNPISAVFIGYFSDNIWKMISPFKGATPGTVIQNNADLAGDNHEPTDGTPPAPAAPVQ